MSGCINEDIAGFVVCALVFKDQGLVSHIKSATLRKRLIRNRSPRILAPGKDLCGLFVSDVHCIFGKQVSGPNVVCVFVTVNNVRNRFVGDLANCLQVPGAKIRQRINCDHAGR